MNLAYRILKVVLRLNLLIVAENAFIINLKIFFIVRSYNILIDEKKNFSSISNNFIFRVLKRKIEYL